MTILSIIVPVYNVEDYISGCLDSLLNQTLKDIEIICVDDCGSDSSINIVKQYMQKDKRIKLVAHDQNKGLGAARNTGLKYASSELVAFVDSDDTLVPEAYETAVSKMTSDVDMVCFGIQVIGAADKETQKADDSYYTIKYAGKTKITEDVLHKTDVSACNKIFRKSLLDKHHISFPEGVRYEDAYFFNVYGIRSQTAFFIPDKFYRYIRRDNSIMHATFSQKAGHSIDHLKVAIKLYDYLRQNNLFMAYEYYFGQVFLDYLHFALRHEHTQKGREAIFNLAITFLKEENLSFNSYFDLSRNFEMVFNRTFCQKYRKKLLGLIKIKESKAKKTFYFLGIPVWKIKYREKSAKHYLLSCIRIYKTKYTHEFTLNVKLATQNFVSLNYDNMHLLNELKQAEPFTYIPNPGNMGDVLIAAATLDFFDAHNLNYKMFDGKDFSGTLVYGGGGGLVPYYQDHWQKLLKNSKHAHKIIILPSSIKDVPDFVSKLDNRFVIFTRDKASYDYLVSQKTPATVYLDYDMALRSTKQLLRSSFIIKSRELWSLSSMAKRLKDMDKCAYFMRKDVESVGHYPSDLDISDCFWLSETSTKEWIRFGAQMMLAAVDYFDAIVTDRLHVGIAGVLMGKEVYWLDNSYGKISGVYKHSLVDVPGIHLCSNLPKKEDIHSKHTSTNNIMQMLNNIQRIK